MVQKAKNFWKRLDGHKTKIGVFLHIVWFVIYIVFKDIATTEQQMIGHGLIFQLTGIGLAHKGYKYIKSKTTNADNGKLQ